jgi:hypothetical protein
MLEAGLVAAKCDCDDQILWNFRIRRILAAPYRTIGCLDAISRCGNAPLYLKPVWCLSLTLENKIMIDYSVGIIEVVPKFFLWRLPQKLVGAILHTMYILKLSLT